jgi:hypothetical protein
VRWLAVWGLRTWSSDNAWTCDILTVVVVVIEGVRQF